MLFSLQDMKMGAMGPEKMEGYAVLHVKDTGPLVQMAGSQLPGIDLTADGKAHALPSMLPFKGHFAINGDTVALALGTGSESTASDLLGDKPAASPLWFMVFDYARLGQIMPQGAGADPDFEMFKLFGIGTFQAGVDDRGLFGWFSIEVK